MSCVKLNAGSIVSKNLVNIRLSDEESTTGDLGVGAMAHPLVFVKNISWSRKRSRKEAAHISTKFFDPLMKRNNFIV